jgi:cold shock CspA family protein
VELGKIKTIQPNKGFGFIVPDDGSGDIYFKTASSPISSSLRRDLRVTYSVTTDERTGRLNAVDVQAQNHQDIEEAETVGRVKFWSEDKGFGFVAVADGQDLYMARRSTRFRNNLFPSEGDEVRVRYINSGDRNPLITDLEIISVAPWKPSGIPLFDYSDIGSRQQIVDQLALLAEHEPWDNRREPTGGKPILDSYLRYTFVRLQEEGKISVARSGLHSAFNTGLVTPLQEEIFALFVKNQTPDRQPWQFLGFRKKSDRTLLENFGSNLPDLANYFDDPSVLLYDRRLNLHISIDHVLEHIDRFPEALRGNEFLARGAIQAAEVNTRSRVYRNYKSAIPQWYRDVHAQTSSIQLLLPLCLQQPDKADLALVVDRIGGAYRGNTVLTLDMAYRNARLLARPDSDWLIP